MDNEEIGKYAGMLPSRAMLARLSLFGTDEETRNSANAILKALPPMNERERREYLDETWRLAGLSEAEMALSPVGLATLEMLNNTKPMGGNIESNDSLDSEPSQEDGSRSESNDSVAIESTNEIMARQLSDWPPKGTPQKAVEQDDGPKRLWVAGRPTPETRGDLKPISDSDFSNNDPLY